MTSLAAPWNAESVSADRWRSSEIDLHDLVVVLIRCRAGDHWRLLDLRRGGTTRAGEPQWVCVGSEPARPDDNRAHIERSHHPRCARRQCGKREQRCSPDQVDPLAKLQAMIEQRPGQCTGG